MNHCFISWLICTKKNMNRLLKVRMKTGAKNMIKKSEGVKISAISSTTTRSINATSMGKGDRS